MKDDALTIRPRPRAWGIQSRYRRADLSWHNAAADGVQAVLSAMGAEGAEPEPRADTPLVVIAGSAHAELTAPGEVELETGAAIPIGAGRDTNLPLGYHRLHRNGTVRPLIAVPERCHLPPDLHGFGFAVQLYATRSRDSWGIGDLVDLRELGRWAAGLGAAVLLVNPLHAVLPEPPVEASPYFPSSRLFRNPLYLRVEAVPGFDSSGVDALAERGRGLQAERRIDRDAVAELKLAALARVFAAGDGARGADAAMARRPLLGDFALYCALAELHGRDWRTWPAPLRDREPGALSQSRASLSERIRFHAWMQVALDAQEGEAATDVRLIGDLAVGVDPAGADAWIWQRVFAPGVTVGAPPDLFNTLGQDWSLPPFDPWKLRDAAYQPFIETVRSNLRRGGGLRVDHVMGLHRLWWVPPGLDPSSGAYVEYPVDDLLGILALESVRQQAIVVGEDLGTVEPRLRETLRRRGLLSYRLLLFEDRPPREWPLQALAAVTTHDLPTTAGLWDGSDLDAQRRLDRAPNVDGTSLLMERIRRGGPELNASVEAAILHAHRQLAESPCMLLSATLEDIAAVPERPNHPGTTTAQNPNWCMALPVLREELQQMPLAANIAALLRRD